MYIVHKITKTLSAVNFDFPVQKVTEWKTVLDTTILGRYAPLILAPAESSSVEPCTFDYLILII
jgi:hypothetical protein